MLGPWCYAAGNGPCPKAFKIKLHTRWGARKCMVVGEGWKWEVKGQAQGHADHLWQKWE